MTFITYEMVDFPCDARTDLRLSVSFSFGVTIINHFVF